MQVEGRVFVGVAVFLGTSSLVYWSLSKDPTGGVALAFAAGLAFLIGYYLFFTGRRIPPRPEDIAEAEISDGAGEVGFFSPHSYWPLGMGLGVALIALGFVFGVWIILIGIGTLVASLAGLLFEYYVGYYSRERTEAGSS